MKKYISLVIFAVILIIWLILKPYNATGDYLGVIGQPEDENNAMVPFQAPSDALGGGNETTKDIIIRLAAENNFDTETALRIAECESQYGKYKTNWQGSSAQGVYQFMPKTFNDYCEGNINNDKDQILCFFKLYKEHSNWWKCK